MFCEFEPLRVSYFVFGGCQKECMCDRKKIKPDNPIWIEAKAESKVTELECKSRVLHS